MTIPVKDTGGGEDFTPVPEGIHQAICIAVVDLGAQQTTWQGEVQVKHQIWIRWEIPALTIDYEKDGQKMTAPMSIGKIYTASLSKKANLRKDLEAWRGRAFTPAELEGFDVATVLGVPCQIQVQHTVKGEKTYSNVVAVVGWPAGLPVPEPKNPLLTYGDDDQGQFSELPKWIQEKINGRTPVSTGPSVPPAAPPTPQPIPAAPPPAPHTADFDDDIPF